MQGCSIALLFLFAATVNLSAQTESNAGAATPASPPAQTAPAAPVSPDASLIPVIPESQKKLVAPPEANVEHTLGSTAIVKEIEVEYAGPKSVSKGVILSNMRTTVGQPYSTTSVEEDIRNLYATGLFVNLRISDEPLADGVKVTVIVQPKPLVREVVIVGYEKIKEKRLKKEIKTKPGEPLSEMQVATDQQKIAEYYQSKGFKNVKVTSKIDTNEEFGRSVVTFNVSEGDRSFVTEVNIIGNVAFTEKVLRKQLKTRKKNLFSFINKSGLYKDDDFEEDKKKLRDFYFDHGYIDMEIKEDQIKFAYPAKDQMTVTIPIFEGIQYKVGKISFAGNELYKADTIHAVLKMKEDGVFSPKGLETDIKNITDLYGKLGYIDTKVDPQRTANVESGRIDLVYHINDGAQSFVEKIIIQGNYRTKDKVLRRELALAPGDVYDSTRAEASKKRLENLGFFEAGKVDITPQDTAIPNRRNMVVTVEEKRTASITFGVGFSTVDSLLGFVELQQGNFDIANFPYFTGAGQKFRMKVQYGLISQSFLMSFTEPWFMDQRLSLGFDLFYNNSNDQLNQLYNVRDVGFDVRMAKPLNQFWKTSVQYKLEQISIYDIDPSATNIIQIENGDRTKSSITFGLTYDTRDSAQLTRKGELVSFSVEGAGGPLLGQTDIYALTAKAQKYFLLPYDLIFSINSETGVVNHYDRTSRVDLFDRFFIGGARSVRGFENRDVGPKDYTGEDIGGRTEGFTNLELTYPIIDRVRGAVFFDAGFDDDDFARYDHIMPDYNSAAGVGLRMNLPIGPLRFDLGFPIKHDSYNDSTMKFDFDVGYQF